MLYKARRTFSTPEVQVLKIGKSSTSAGMKPRLAPIVQILNRGDGADHCWIFKQSMEARNRVGIGFVVLGRQDTWAGLIELDSLEPIPWVP